MGLIATIHARGVHVALYNASPGVREVFEITKPDRVVTFHDVEAEREWASPGR